MIRNLALAWFGLAAALAGAEPPQDGRTGDASAGALSLALSDSSHYTPDAPPELRVDLIRVIKHERILYLLSGDHPVRAYPVALGDQPVGHKKREGDERTPEGRYVIDWRNPDSRFYRSLHISYPNEADRARAEAEGVDPGGMIMIHGWPNTLESEDEIARLLYTDWTNGCIAVPNTAMREIWESVPVGTPVEILP
ncbi:MAG: hypothetical protein D6758_06885 [Gammaproteobacteria bacterium]|nr:MAG: hypothetical protein D6758_06885 [Gammaproteobacteria bacterium]